MWVVMFVCKEAETYIRPAVVKQGKDKDKAPELVWMDVDKSGALVLMFNETPKGSTHSVHCTEVICLPRSRHCLPLDPKMGLAMEFQPCVTNLAEIPLLIPTPVLPHGVVQIQ